MNANDDLLFARCLAGDLSSTDLHLLEQRLAAGPECAAKWCAAVQWDFALHCLLAPPARARKRPVAAFWIPAAAAALVLVWLAWLLQSPRGVEKRAHSPAPAAIPAVPPPAQSVAEPNPPPPATTPPCEVDLKKAGQMSDIISNVLLRVEHKPEPEVQAFLKDAHKNYATGDDLLKAAAAHFKIEQKRLAELVEKWRHINCRHAAIPGYVAPDPAPAAEPEETADEASSAECKIDLRRAGQMSDIISNVLLRVENKPRAEVRAFLKDAHKNYATGDDLLKAAAVHFKIEQKRLAELVEHWRHINCHHAVPPGYTVPDALRKAAAEKTSACIGDLKSVGHMKDIVSNVLTRAEHKPEADVQAFLKDAGRFATSDELCKAAADQFKIEQKRMAQLVEYWQHINCTHAAIPGYAVPDHAAPGDGAGTGAGRKAPMGAALAPSPVSVPDFAADVTLHVVLHELGHAVIREFDLMVLGNEETMADAFATHLLTEHFPEQAVRVISARVRSLMIEASEVPRDQWTVRGEHDNDARRAYQIAALAIAADKEKYAGVAEIVGMSQRDIENACDYGADIHRAWRRTLAPLMMPAGKVSKEARFRADESTRTFVGAGKPSLATTIESALQRIDWHSQVTVEFVQGSGGAAWSRSKRTVTVNSGYLERFIAQGGKAEAPAAPGEPERR